MRSKYGEYPEYHTSLDKLGSVVTTKGLSESYYLYQKIILNLEKNFKYIANTFCEPFLSKRNLYKLKEIIFIFNDVVRNDTADVGGHAGHALPPVRGGGGVSVPWKDDGSSRPFRRTALGDGAAAAAVGAPGA